MILNTTLVGTRLALSKEHKRFSPKGYVATNEDDYVVPAPINTYLPPLCRQCLMHATILILGYGRVHNKAVFYI
jgi:hypothetical protein